MPPVEIAGIHAREREMANILELRQVRKSTATAVDFVLLPSPPLAVSADPVATASRLATSHGGDGTAASTAIAAVAR